MGQTTLDGSARNDDATEAVVAEAPAAAPEEPQPAAEPVPEPAPPAPRRKPKRTRAHELAEEQRDIPISEFFEQNRHILGFDNPTHSLITAVKEAVDNALDACEQASILPEVQVALESLGRDELRISVEDNGPGILKEQIPMVFGRLLYGSRFGSGKQSRGQQGIGISAAIMYGQLTTGRPAEITSRISADHLAEKVTLKLDTRHNRGIIDRSEPRPRQPRRRRPAGRGPESGSRLRRHCRSAAGAGRPQC